MRVIYGIKQIKKFRKPVVALGVFDGVHLAHRRILKEAVRKARAIKGRSVVVTFWPHPQKEESLYSLEHRLNLIKEIGVKVCIVINFNPRFAQIPAQDFVKYILSDKIGAKYIYVGKNFRFGKKARGDWRLLEKLSPKYNFRLKTFAVIKINRQLISSTYIRRLIKEGKLRTAKRLLLRPVSILGTVIRGTSLAKKIGFPTANIDPHHEVLPPSGVYAVKIIFDKREFYGVCNIGIKPTFKMRNAERRTQSARHIEVHIFNFKKNIYGKFLEIQFIKKLRSEKKFAQPKALAQQIKKDILQARRLFSLP